VVVLLLKLLPIVIMFSTESHGYLVVTAVGSDVVGIVYVLLSAMALMKMKPRFANTPCGADSLAAPEVLKEAELPQAEAAPGQATAPVAVTMVEVEAVSATKTGGADDAV